MENSAKSFDVFGFKEEELPNMVVTRVCSESVASEALNIHRALENEYFDIGGMSRFDDGEQINSRNQELFHHDDSVDAVSDTDESMNVNSRTPSASPANHDLCEDGPSSENCQSHWEMGENMAIVFNPDFIYYRETYYTDCVVNFSNSYIEVKGSVVSGNMGTFSIQFTVEDIKQIHLEYSMTADAGQFKIRVISRCPEQSETIHEASGIEELQFSVHDSGFREKCEAITSVDGYKAVWHSNSEADDHCMGVQRDVSKPSSKRYFPSCDESFEEVIYPKGDSDAVSISKRDFDLLQPDTFVNDTIIDFYIKYLKNKIQPERRHRYHFFNSFFFRKLADMDKDPSNAFDGRAAFLRVRKWTRKLNLFEKDFVFIPVNYNLHWSLIVICHPGEVAKFEDDILGKLSRVPCILHMDSLRGSHTGLKDLLQSYLWEEWKERQKELSEDVSAKFLNLRFASLELPQQQNFCDCGLFLLHYVECFLEEDPADINPFSITKNSHFLSMDWFHPDEPSCKRSYIQRLIHDILQNRSCENSPSGENESCVPFNPLERGNHDQNAVEFISDQFGSKSCHGDLLCPQTSQGFEMSRLSASSLKDGQCPSSSGLVLRESFEPESNLHAQIVVHFDRSISFSEVKNSLPSIEEEVETGGNFVYASSNATGFGDLGAVASETFVFPYSSRDAASEASWKTQVPVHHAADEHIGSSPATICHDQNDLEVGIDGKCKAVGKESLDDCADQLASTVEENTECFTESLPAMFHVAAEPQNGVEPHSQNGIEDSLTASQNLSELPQIEFHDNTNIVSRNLDAIGSDVVVQHAAKKMRLMTPVEREVELNLSEDLHL
ncbi:probable ubiquitin-like-specific protease 2B isoform X3 [Ipomoea triloba]|uniref:probable ubiquitin-like-specific protease 2B isoform X3 n=1 Tax=Ipomoea triloba TaxID=35885 RepID=UPI00125D3540|nr:probable ubiquitin-like-specific protease 2B isoform X3 [Ipomoea triloba]